MARIITREEFDAAVAAVWTEIEYRNSLSRRTEDEAKDVPGFLTLLRRYIRKAEDAWSDNPGTVQPDGSIQVEEALHGLRKLAMIAMASIGLRQTHSRHSRFDGKAP